jgi:wyosine [tRNA(Phe)-imidazoG37] synthetase (radical SAM superfamily)
MSITFGPINSRRFGKSLGVDLSPNKKQCNFDCLYCELEPTKTISSYSDIIEVDNIITAIKEALKTHKDIDFITLTANGEPTLYPKLNELIEKLNSIKGDIKSLILSNGSTILNPDIQDALSKLDVVKLSLDCATIECFKKLDRVDNSVSLEAIKKGMLEFTKLYNGTLQIEILFVKGVNDKPKEIEELNSFLLQLKPDIIDLSTIDRPPAFNVKPLSYSELYEISLLFDASLNINIATKNRDIKSLYNYSKDEIIATLSMRPLREDDIEVLFTKESKESLQELLNSSKIKLDNGFYRVVK